jgi:predicted transcriptional regulator
MVRLDQATVAGVLMSQIECYRVLKVAGTKMSARELMVALGSTDISTVQYFCKRLHDHGCIEREQTGSCGGFVYWIGDDAV